MWNSHLFGALGWNETAQEGLAPGLPPIPSYPQLCSSPHCRGPHVDPETTSQTLSKSPSNSCPLPSLGPGRVTLAEKRPEQALEGDREFSGPGYSDGGLGNGADSGWARLCWPCRLFVPRGGDLWRRPGQGPLTWCQNDAEW